MIIFSLMSTAGLKASWKDSYSFRAMEMRMVFSAADHTGVSFRGSEVVCILLVEDSAQKPSWMSSRFARADGKS